MRITESHGGCCAVRMVEFFYSLTDNETVKSIDFIKKNPQYLYHGIIDENLYEKNWEKVLTDLGFYPLYSFKNLVHSGNTLLFLVKYPQDNLTVHPLEKEINNV